MLPWETQEMLEIELPHLSEGRSTLTQLDSSDHAVIRCTNQVNSRFTGFRFSLYSIHDNILKFLKKVHA